MEALSIPALADMMKVELWNELWMEGFCLVQGTATFVKQRKRPELMRRQEEYMYLEKQYGEIENF